MQCRVYDPQKDKDAVHRIWLETGWIEKGKEETMDVLLQGADGIVADISGEAECLVLTMPGTIRYLNDDLALLAVAAVTTSRVARKQGFASRLTARAIANGVAKGALVAALGMFEQGYYNQLGFGTGGYEHMIAFDPASLLVHEKARVPRRLRVEDAEIIHAARLARALGHGACSILPVQMTKTDMLWTTNGFGLGYFDGPKGELTHGFWGGAKDVERGPYNIGFMFYQTTEQFRELLGLLRNLGDQVHVVKMREPRGVQMQDLVKEPFKLRQMTENSPFSTGTRAAAYWQMRICDLPACLARTHLRGNTSRFNLKLSDPIAPYLEETAPWRGVGGDYIVTLGPESSGVPGHDPALPLLTASVGAFTRLWLGVRPASGLAVTDEISGPPALLDELDWALNLPECRTDWDF